MSSKVIALVISFLLVLPAGAERNGEEAVRRLVAIISHPSADSNSSARSTVSSKAARQIDYAYIAKSILEGNKWEELSTSKQQEFVLLLRKLIERRYYKRWHRLFIKGKLTFVSEREEGDKAEVVTRLKAKEKDYLLHWKLHKQDGKLKVVDLVVNKKDLVGRMKAKVQHKLAKGGFKRVEAYLNQEAAN